jgi:hypothetical protein
VLNGGGKVIVPADSLNVSGPATDMVPVMLSALAIVAEAAIAAPRATILNAVFIVLLEKLRLQAKCLIVLPP